MLIESASLTGHLKGNMFLKKFHGLSVVEEPTESLGGQCN